MRNFAAATPAALCILRGVACGAVRDLDVTGSRFARRGDILDLVRESPQLRTLRCCVLRDNGKWSVQDVDAVFEAWPSLALFECDVGDSGCVDSAHGVLECAAVVARAGRLRSVDASWSLKLGYGTAQGCAAMMEKRGGGFPLQRLAIRKANIEDPGAMLLAGPIRRSAEAVAAKEKATRRNEWSGLRRQRQGC